MLNITYTINGRRIDPQNSNAIEKAILEGVVEKAIGVVKSKLTPDEADKITIAVKGDSLDKLSLNARGPGEIVDKLKKAL